MAGDGEPPLPMEVRIKSLYTSEDTVISTFIKQHISKCSSLVQPPSTDPTHTGHTHSQCTNAVCAYFKWYSDHSGVCKKGQCRLCEKFKRWILLHSKDCVQSCVLDQCKTRKIQQLRNRLKTRDSRFMAAHLTAMTPNPTSNRTLIDAHHQHTHTYPYNRSISQPIPSPSTSPSPEPLINPLPSISQLNGFGPQNGHASLNRNYSPRQQRRVENDSSATCDPNDSVTYGVQSSPYSIDEDRPLTNEPIERQQSLESYARDFHGNLSQHHGRFSRASIDNRAWNDFNRNMSISSSVSSCYGNRRGTGYSVVSESGTGGEMFEEENVDDGEMIFENGVISRGPPDTEEGSSPPLKHPLQRQDTNPPEQIKMTLEKSSISFSHLKEIKHVQENYFRSNKTTNSDKKSGTSDSSDYYSSAPHSAPSSDQDLSDFSSLDEDREVMDQEHLDYHKQQQQQQQSADPLNHIPPSSFLYNPCYTTAGADGIVGVGNMELENTSEGTVKFQPSAESDSHRFSSQGDPNSMSTVCNSGSLSSPNTLKSFETGQTGSYNSHTTMNNSTPSSIRDEREVLLSSDDHHRQQEDSQTGFSSLQLPSQMSAPSSPNTHSQATPPHTTLAASQVPPPLTPSPSHSTSGNVHPYAFDWGRHRYLSISSATSETSSFHDDTSMESSIHSHSSPRPSLLELRPMSSAEVNEICERVDELRTYYHCDIERMNNMGKMMEQQVPEERIDGHEVMDCSHQFDWDMDCDFCTQAILENVLTSRDPQREKLFYEFMMRMQFTESEKQIRRQLDQQSDFRMYLINQFYNNCVYREGEHWRRKDCLGAGGQGSCFSIHDYETSLTLALKEAPENKKALKEAYVCLKLAHLSNASQNVLEYFSAALLPSNYIPGDESRIQIFMEIMPTSFQSCLCVNGPMHLDHIHHYGYQLFDALDYLHSHGIIHCDIKPANILVDESAQRLKLADFGAAALTDDFNGSEGQKDLGTLTYNPPEYYSHSESGFAMDIWQAGCCVLAMSTGRRPWRHLFMDVLKGRQSAELTNEIKRQQRDLIGSQTSGHFYPTFLDEPLQKLLYGCLHANKASRPSAQDCAYMLVQAGATNDEQRAKVSQALKFHRSEPHVLQDFKMADSYIDVFLASRFENIVVDGACHGMMPGWLGCVEYYDGMTYREMRDSVFQEQLPVVRHFPPFTMAASSLSPQEHFKNVTLAHDERFNSPSGQQHLTTLYRPVSLDSCVDPTKSLVIFRSPVMRTLC